MSPLRRRFPPRLPRMRDVEFVAAADVRIGDVMWVGITMAEVTDADHLRRQGEVQLVYLAFANATELRAAGRAMQAFYRGGDSVMREKR